MLNYASVCGLVGPKGPSTCCLFPHPFPLLNAMVCPDAPFWDYISYSCLAETFPIVLAENLFVRMDPETWRECKAAGIIASGSMSDRVLMGINHPREAVTALSNIHKSTYLPVTRPNSIDTARNVALPATWPCTNVLP